MKLLLGLALLSSSAFGVYSVGDKIKNDCYSSLGGKVCMDDQINRGFVQVLLFNATWCGPCNAEFKEIVPAAEKFAGKKVVFISVTDDAKNDTTLKGWQDRFKIGQAKAYWVIAGGGQAGRAYFNSPSIPNVAIIDASGKLVYKAIAPGVREILRQAEAAIK